MAPSNKQDREARKARERVRAYQARRAVNEHQTKRRVRDNILAGVGLVVVLVVAVGAQLFFFNGGPGTPTEAAGANTGEVPSTDIAENRVWNGTLTLNDIPLEFELDGALAPQAVSSTVDLIQTGFYEDVPCHRLTSKGLYVLQCGDPTGTGTGGPNYSYGPVENAPADNFYPAGTIAMARQPNDGYSMGSQFFIVYEDTTLGSDEAGGYTVIGTVTSGLDELTTEVIDAGVEGGSTDGAPAVPTTITAVTVH